jgi:hypothetical protein
MRVRLVPTHRVNFHNVMAREWHEKFLGSGRESRVVVPRNSQLTRCPETGGSEAIANDLDGRPPREADRQL